MASANTTEDHPGLAQGARSLLWQPRLAQAFEHDRHGICARDPFDREFGTEAQGLRQSRPRLVHLTGERIGGRKLFISVAYAITRIDRLADQFYGRVEMT